MAEKILRTPIAEFILGGVRIYPLTDPVELTARQLEHFSKAGVVHSDEGLDAEARAEADKLKAVADAKAKADQAAAAKQEKESPPAPAAAPLAAPVVQPEPDHQAVVDPQNVEMRTEAGEREARATDAAAREKAAVTARAESKAAPAAAKQRYTGRR